MTETLDELTWSTDGRRLSFTIDESLYPRDAVYGAVYLFVDRCFVFLDRPADQKISIRLTPKSPAEPAAIEALAGELANELLNQTLRFRLAESTGRLREYTFARAFFSTPTSASIDALLAELDAEELASDPLEVEVPWARKDGGDGG